MSSRKINVEDSTRPKHTLLNIIVSSFLAMRFCKNYFRVRVSCRIDDEFKKCVEYVFIDQICDFVISSTTIKQIQRERKKIRDEIRKTRAAAKTIIIKINRLKRQLEALINQKKELISIEWQNIIELKANEQIIAINLFFNFFFDVAFEQFQLFADFDWFFVPLFDLDEIFAKNVDSSQGSR